MAFDTHNLASSFVIARTAQLHRDASQTSTAWSTCQQGNGSSTLQIANQMIGLSRGSPQSDITRAFRGAILSGSIAPGAQMPSETLLASALGIAAGRTLRAYATLADEGLLLREGEIWRVRLAPQPGRQGAVQHDLPLHMLPRRVLAAMDHVGAAASLGLPLTPGDGPLDLFPSPTWMRLCDRLTKMTGKSVLRRAEAEGFAPLRDALAAHVRYAFGIPATAQRVFVLSGVQRAIGAVTRALLEIGNEAWLEAPASARHLGALVTAQARGVPVRTDSQGMVIDDAVAQAPVARLAIVRPLDSVLAGRLDQTRAVALIAWAAQVSSWIVADYSGCEIRSSCDEPNLLAGSDRVIHVGGFESLLFPALDVAWVVVPDGLVDVFAAATRVWEEPPLLLTQAALADLLSSPAFGVHLQRAIEARAERLAALQEGLAARVSWIERILHLPQSSGLRAFIRADGVQEISAHCREQGIGVQPIETQDGSVRGLHVGFAGTPASRVATAAVRLGAAIDRVQRHGHL